jgi:cytochrome c2
MNTRLIVRSLLSVVALLAVCTSVAVAGGWAVITLDNFPTQVTAGQELSIGFTVRQHGQTLRSDLKPIVRFEQAATKDSLQVTAQREGAEGHYVAVATLPAAGEWNWQVDIEQFGMLTQPMPALTVQAAPAKATLTKAEPSLLSKLMTFIRALRQAFDDDSASAAPVSLTAAQTAPLDQVALGKALFSAKGCVMCHAHAGVKMQDGPFGFGESAPNLSQKTYGDEYLRLWLKSPQDVKPQTKMPQLQLKEHEIEALIAFLQSR